MYCCRASWFRGAPYFQTVELELIFSGIFIVAPQSDALAKPGSCCCGRFPTRPCGGSGVHLQNIVWILTHGQNLWNSFTSQCLRVMNFLYVLMSVCGFGKQFIDIFHFRWPQKRIFRPIEISTRFHTFWPPCRSVSTVQSILNLVFTCLWFWRLRSFHYGILSHICFFSNSFIDSDIMFFNYTSAADLYQQFHRCWHSRSICINSFIDSEILDVRAVH